IEGGSTISDFEPEEVERQSSIYAAVVGAEWNGKRLNIIDTPGYADFIGSALGALSAVETAVVVVNAANGVEMGTRRLGAVAADRGLARMVVVNKADSESADLAAVVSQIQEAFGPACRLLFIPVGQGPDFKGVVSVIEDQKAEGALMDVAEAHRELVEAIVEADDALMERYLADETISPEELRLALTRAMSAGTLVPIVFTSAKSELGIKELLDAIAGSAPSPVEGLQRTAVRGDGDSAEEVTLNADAGAPLCAQVFKIRSDPYVGKVAVLRIYSGRLAVDGTARIGDAKRETRFSQLFSLQGKEYEAISEAVAGDIVATTKIDSLTVSETIYSGSKEMKMPPIKFPVPMFSLAIEPKSRGDEQKISEAVSKALDEDPTLMSHRDTQTKELVISGLGDVHISVTLARFKRRYGVEVETKLPKVPYRETITAKAEGHYRHKKQTGGAGQFGEVYLRVEPLLPAAEAENEEGGRKRGKGSRVLISTDEFELVNDIFGGSIPAPFLPPIGKGIQEAMHEGIIAGYPMQKVRVSVYDGKHHPVDSKEIAFRIAGRGAFRDAVLKAKPVLLEPHVKITISVPDRFLGDITGDLNSRRGRIHSMETEGSGLQSIHAQVPLAEVLRYNTELRSMTGGQGSYSMEFSHYDAVPAHIQQQIVADYEANRQKE
ncbi:MAG: elongation factor G, partial [Planctomycetia bacterium]|nr:elongation factor G [Planctomycetia bacterium]